MKAILLSTFIFLFGNVTYIKFKSTDYNSHLSKLTVDFSHSSYISSTTTDGPGDDEEKEEDGGLSDLIPFPLPFPLPV